MKPQYETNGIAIYQGDVLQVLPQLEPRSGTTALVARDLNCRAVGVELNEEYIGIAARRLKQEVLAFA